MSHLNISSSFSCTLALAFDAMLLATQILHDVLCMGHANLYVVNFASKPYLTMTYVKHAHNVAVNI